MGGSQQVQAPRLLLAGAAPGANAGNAVSSEVLLEALRAIADVTLLSHRMSPLPTWRANGNGSGDRVLLGTQPFSIHGEALLAGTLHRAKLHAWQGAWVVNSRYAGALSSAGVPYVIWEATTTRDELRASSSRAVRRSGRGTGLGRTMHRMLLPIGERLERMLYRRAVAVVTMSEYTRERIVEVHALNPNHIRVLPHPPSMTFVRALANSNGAAPTQSVARDGTWRMLFVGRVDDPRKNFGLLLDALRQLRSAGQHASLTVVGAHNAGWRAGLNLAGVGDVVRFEGAVSVQDLADAYRSHDVLVVPSRQEGFGIVVAEAFAAGLPVVATRCGGPEQIIAQSGGGILVDHDAAELSAAISGVLGDPPTRTRMRTRALAYAESVLSFTPFAHAVAEITSELLDVSRVARR